MMRRTTTCWTLLAVLLPGCVTNSSSGPYRAIPRTTVDPEDSITLDAIEFERGPTLLLVQREPLLDSAAVINVPDVTDVSNRPGDSTSWHVVNNDRPMRAAAVEICGRRFLVLRSRQLVCVEDRADAEKTVVPVVNVASDGGLAQGIVQFDAFAMNGRIWIVYSGTDGLYQVQGDVEANGVRFGPARLIIGTKSPAKWLQTAASKESAHVIFQTGHASDSTLHYARTDNPSTDWSPSRAISGTGSRGFMLVEGREIFILWTDLRFSEGTLLMPATYRKLMIAKSSNDGGTFGQSVLLSKRGDQSDDSDIQCMFPCKNGLIILFPGDRQDDRATLSARRLRMMLVDRDLKRGTFVGETSGRGLTVAWTRRLLEVSQVDSTPNQ